VPGSDWAGVAGADGEPGEQPAQVFDLAPDVAGADPGCLLLDDDPLDGPPRYPERGRDLGRALARRDPRRDPLPGGRAAGAGETLADVGSGGTSPVSVMSAATQGGHKTVNSQFTRAATTQAFCSVVCKATTGVRQRWQFASRPSHRFRSRRLRLSLDTVGPP